MVYLIGNVHWQRSNNFFSNVNKVHADSLQKKPSKHAKRNSNNLDASKKQPQPNLHHIFWAQQDERGRITGN